MTDISGVIVRLCSVVPLSMEALLGALDGEPPEEVKKAVHDLIHAGRVFVTVDWKIEAKV